VVTRRICRRMRSLPPPVAESAAHGRIYCTAPPCGRANHRPARYTVGRCRVICLT
jgi:hypothetical protein